MDDTGSKIIEDSLNSQEPKNKKRRKKNTSTINLGAINP